MPGKHEGESDGNLAEQPKNPKERAQWWRELIGPPPTRQQVRTAEKYIERQVQNMGRGAYRDAGINGWDDLGPKNIGGRIRAIAVNPDDTDEIFIGGVAGGVWRSSDAGMTWEEVTSPPQSYPVTSIVIDPNNTDIIFAATGEYVGSGLHPGIGILKSINGGDSWYETLPPPGNDLMWLGKIIINPLDSDILYAVGSDGDENQNGSTGIVCRSNDAGETWNILWTENVNPVSPHIFDIDINPNDTSELIAGTFFQPLISDDSGANWSSLAGSNPPLIVTPMNYARRRCEVEFCNGSPANIYVLRYLQGTGANAGTFRSELWQSSDGGSTWTLQTFTTGSGSGDSGTNILSDQGNYDNTLWVDPSNCSRAIMGGIDLWKWANSTLTKISNWEDDIDGNAFGNDNSIHADQHAIVPDPNYDGSTNNRVYIGNDGGIYKSENIWTATNNSGWSSLNTELNITQFYGLDVSLSGDTLVGGSQDNSYFVDRTGLGNDLNWGIYSTGDGGHGGIKRSNPEIMYASTQTGNFYKSSDGGDTFCQVLSLDSSDFNVPNCGNFTMINDGPAFIAPFEVDPNDDQTLYAGAVNLWESPNEGGTWISRFTCPASRIGTIEIAKGDSDILWIGIRDGNIWMSTDGGTNWSQVNAAGMPGSVVADIAINPNNHDEVMCVFGGGFQDSLIWYTSDAGQNWEVRDLDFDMGTLAVTWHPMYSDWVYVGTRYGIFASEDKGLNWNVTPFFNESEGPVYITVVELVWQGNGSTIFPYYLVAATHGRGAWRSRSPIFNKYYVDKNCDPCGLGSLSVPFATFREAVNAAGSGTEIIFLSGGTYDEVPSEILSQRRIMVTLDPGAGSPVIIE